MRLFILTNCLLLVIGSVWLVHAENEKAALLPLEGISEESISKGEPIEVKVVPEPLQAEKATPNDEPKAKEEAPKDGAVDKEEETPVTKDIPLENALDSSVLLEQKIPVSLLEKRIKEGKIQVDESLLGRSLFNDVGQKEILEDENLTRLARRLREFHQLRLKDLNDGAMEKSNNALDSVGVDEDVLAEERAVRRRQRIRRKNPNQTKRNRNNKLVYKKTQNNNRQRVNRIRPNARPNSMKRYRPSNMKPYHRRGKPGRNQRPGVKKQMRNVKRNPQKINQRNKRIKNIRRRKAQQQKKKEQQVQNDHDNEN